VPSLSELQAWDITHLEIAARDWTATAQHWEASFSSIHQAVVAPGARAWEGAAAEAAQQSTLDDLVKVRGWADVLHESAAVARRGADTLMYAKQSVLDAVEDAQVAGCLVGEDLSVTPPPEAGVTGAAEAQVYAADIRERVAQLVAHDKEIAGKITAASAPLHAVTFDDQLQGQDERRPLGGVYAAGYNTGTPLPEAPPTPRPIPPGYPQGPPAGRGLPPEGVHPPVDGPLTVGPASRPSERAEGGLSLWDQHGGEWRYDSRCNTHHYPHWDYKPLGKFGKWENIGINGLPTHTEEAAPPRSGIQAGPATPAAPAPKPVEAPLPTPKAPPVEAQPEPPTLTGGGGRVGGAGGGGLGGGGASLGIGGMHGAVPSEEAE